ncbi:dual specificity catalytic domain containing protein [Colletotrichum truncatum]|uniref:Dual specificity catalytic domain containing protein n=1 Tax=Colletotrichum truncatum TaxID=5467 RepID=A0ACC3ZED4_COLTU|nr:dual specificity catalytic domain containing protein [Colletotrichum truncatum]KAF6801365.1 dual specificity catalytic domain containing protein [Colletotrichum truncatum]
MSHEKAKQAPSTEWSDLFSINRSYEPTSYKALDNLDRKPTLAFLHRLFWDEIRAWTQNDATEMSRITHPDLNSPGKIYIGGMNHALNEEILIEHDIRAVITIHPKDSLAWDKTDPRGGLRRFFAKGASVVEWPLIIPLEDNANSNLIDHFDETNEFIKRHSAEGRNILIHCKSGRSRSVAVLIAYLQRKFYDETLKSVGSIDEARSRMRKYREAATESIRSQRLPVVVIMERFQDLLALYDLQLIGHPDYEMEKKALFPAPMSAVRMMPSRVDSILKDPTEGKSPLTTTITNPKVVQTKGGAAVLKICVAWVFFTNNQKPTEAVIHQFFEINEAYFYELEGLEYKGRSYVGSKHACPGLVKFCLEYARGEHKLTLPRHTEEHADLVVSKAQ